MTLCKILNFKRTAQFSTFSERKYKTKLFQILKLQKVTTFYFLVQNFRYKKFIKLFVDLAENDSNIRNSLTVRFCISLKCTLMILKVRTINNCMNYAIGEKIIKRMCSIDKNYSLGIKKKKSIASTNFTRENSRRVRSTNSFVKLINLRLEKKYIQYTYINIMGHG